MAGLRCGEREETICKGDSNRRSSGWQTISGKLPWRPARPALRPSKIEAVLCFPLLRHTIVPISRHMGHWRQTWRAAMSLDPESLDSHPPLEAQRTSLPGIFLIVVGAFNILWSLYQFFSALMALVTPPQQIWEANK